MDNNTRIDTITACLPPDRRWSLQDLGEDVVKNAFRVVRGRLVSAGCALNAAYPFPATQIQVEINNSDDCRKSPAGGCSSLDDDDYAGPGGWPLVARLGWCLRDDGVLDYDGVQRTVAALGPSGRKALADFLDAREAELATDPYLATKSRALRLQFAALGQEWFAVLQRSPTLADYLENEAQIINLEAVLS